MIDGQDHGLPVGHDPGCDGTGHQRAAPMAYVVCRRYRAVHH